MVTVGEEVYPDPPLAQLIMATDVGVRDAVAVAVRHWLLPNGVQEGLGKLTVGAAT